MTLAVASDTSWEEDGGEFWRSHAGIPIRNLWLLLMYACDLASFGDRFDTLADESADLPELLARLLVWIVERRLRQNLSRNYVATSGVLHRVRGRIDWLRTEAGQHLNRGEVVCRYEELTADTPRNRLVRAALEAMAARLSKREVGRKSASLARLLAEHGVGAQRPSRSETARDRIARHDAHDKLMVAVAELTLDTVLPSETAGEAAATRLQRDEALLRRIFERAVAGFYRHELSAREGWRVMPQRQLKWPVTSATDGFRTLLPGMNADIIIEWGGSQDADTRFVVETKFADALTTNAFERDVFKSGHLYQLYAYLQTQTGGGSHAADTATGILLYPVADRNLDEWGDLQGHRIRLATVDLTTSAQELKGRLLSLVQPMGSA